MKMYVSEKTQKNIEGEELQVVRVDYSKMRDCDYVVFVKK